MDLKAYLERFETDVKNEIHTFIDFVHAEERKLRAPFESTDPYVPAPSTDDGNPPAPVVQVPAEEAVAAPVEAEPVVEAAPVVETAPEAKEVPVETAPAEEPVVESNALETETSPVDTLTGK